jgi:hypothetical protein
MAAKKKSDGYKTEKSEPKKFEKAERAAAAKKSSGAKRGSKRK